MILTNDYKLLQIGRIVDKARPVHFEQSTV